MKDLTRSLVSRAKVHKGMVMSAAASLQWSAGKWFGLQRGQLLATASSIVYGATTQNNTATIVHNGKVATYRDPSTWPKYWNARDIEAFLTPIISNSAPKYETLAMLHSSGQTDMLTTLVCAYTTPPASPEVDMNEYLAQRLNNADSAEMHLWERTEQLIKLTKALSPHPGSNKCQIVFSSSPRGSGKSQMIKWFVSNKREDGMKHGRVIVLCCDKERQSHLARMIAGSVDITTFLTEQALCDLVRAHVQSVTGNPQDPRHYLTPHLAYATWISETARHFKIPEGQKEMEPLIILDTCDLLSQHQHQSLVHKSTGKPYTLLETLCRSVPPPYGIFVVGGHAHIEMSDPAYLATANVTDIGPFLPLSEEGALNALTKSWKHTNVCPTAARFLHYMTDGAVRLLRAAQWNDETAEQTCLASHPPNLTSPPPPEWAVPLLLRSCREVARHQYPVHDRTYPYWYTCALAASTKARVRGGDCIAINPAWRTKFNSQQWSYHTAMAQSMGTYDPVTGRFMVPPITFVDAELPNTPIMPSQLYPFLDPNIVKNFNYQRLDTAGREALFDKPFLYAVYARYLLVRWAIYAMDPCNNSDWVSLGKVFEGAVHPDQVQVLERFELNLSHGVREDGGRTGYDYIAENSLTFMGPHGSFLWCRETSKRNEPFAVPLRLWDRDTTQQHPHNRMRSSVLTLFVNRGRWRSTVDERNMMIDATEMSNLFWYAHR
ncbi:Bodo-specific multi-copy gene family, putative [Bodo saltans]|uniref:Bodo-specific multi-copy gene family, putative n=1 Tax=Bodo saltans TaxID=75058 RepID=A0A0S4JHF5_BODSA|nr:Bodo-specific multi-copy gene family, putative [Bodo saltans]|eukprot:CUG89375.1 Bodo-specific multi-copy gene family, putative [Bodo saltans]